MKRTATIAITVLTTGAIIASVLAFASTEALRRSRANLLGLTLSLGVMGVIVLYQQYQLHTEGTRSPQQPIPDVADSSAPQSWLYGSTSLLCLQTGAVILVDGTALVHRAAATDKTIGAYPDRRAAEAALGILAERLNAIKAPSPADAAERLCQAAQPLPKE